VIEVGEVAPDFVAPAAVDGVGEELELFRLVDANDAVVLSFLPGAFVPAATAELVAVSAAGWRGTPGLAPVAVTGDSLFANHAYAARYGIGFPVVSDFGRSIADAYGLLADEWEGHSRIARRATVVVDGEWTVRFAEAAAGPLAEAAPAPSENAVGTLRELGVDAGRPAVDYGGVD